MSVQSVFNGNTTRNTANGGHRGVGPDAVGELGQLPSVTAEVVESAVLLAKAEARLALIEARGLAHKAIVALGWVVFAGFLLHAAVLLLILGPLVSVQLPETLRWGLIGAPFVIALCVAWFALRSLHEVQKNER